MDWLEAYCGCDNGWQLLNCAGNPPAACKRLVDTVAALMKAELRREMPELRYVPDDGGSYLPLSELVNEYEVATVEWKR